VDLTAADVAGLTARREGRDLEFKRGLPREGKVARTLAAFANTRGGVLLVGVGDRGEVLGAPRAAELPARLGAIAARLLEPPLDVRCGVVRVAERPVAWCSVPLSARRPHSVATDDGGREVVVRVGSSNRVASGATLAALSAQRRDRRRPDALQRAVLAWVAGRARGGSRPDGDATVAGFARARNVGLQRARRAFTRLEIAGRLVAHGVGSGRTYSIA